MSYRRQTQDEGWPRWLRERQSELIACGLPTEAYQTEMDWFRFLDHGYIQARDVHISQWWSINALNAKQAKALRDFLVREYGTGFPELIRSLESLAAGGGDSLTL